MSRQNTFIETIFEVATDAVNKGIAHLYTEDNKLSGNKIHLKGKEVANFGSCSYLGLEFDQRLINGAKDAIEKYGTQFSESRAYVSVKHYQILEELLMQLFNSPIQIAPTTTLGHIAAIPVLVNDGDAIILDHQVHFSVHTAVNIVKSRGVHVEMIRHNRMDMLEDRIKVLRQKHSRIWYMADGIYSMYGDASPVNEVYELLNRYKELYYYVDDAHGMSCFGKNGSGYVLSQKPIHEKMIIAASLNKAFASGGGVLIFPNQELAGKVRKCGSSFITSGPLQPSQLGAAIAAAKIHLSDEIYSLQEDLHENIKFAGMMLKKYELPLVAETNSPVFFVGVSLPKLGYNMVKRMLDEGYYLNLGIFPAVPIKNTGIRFTITRLHTFKQIESMIAAMAYHFPIAMKEEGISLQQIYKAFRMELPEEKQINQSVTALLNQSNLHTEHYDSITQIKKEEWNALLGERGTYDWEGMRFLEDSFSRNELQQDNWTFDYLMIKDNDDKTILATFLTSALCKDDMLSPAAISAQVEAKRSAGDSFYLTSRVLFVGSLLTEGNHLYLDRTSLLWKDAMHILFEKISELQETHNASVITIRDLEANDDEMDAFLIDNGYFKTMMPESHHININWNDKQEYMNKLSVGSKKHLKRFALRHESKYELNIVTNPTEEEIAHWYQLYLNVKQTTLTLNTYALPYKAFKNMVAHKKWEILTLTLKPEFDAREKRNPITVIFNYITKENYNAMIIGIDYSFQDEYKCYKQALYQVVMRAKELNLKNIHLGFTSSFWKKILGAKPFSSVAYMQVKDNYNMEVLGSMSALATA